MKNFRKIMITVPMMILLSFSLFGIAYAQSAKLDPYTVLAPLPNTTYCDSSGGEGCSMTDFGTYIPGVFNLVISIAGVLAFIVITYGGFLYMTSDSILKTAKGKEHIKNAVTGLLLAIGSWVILNTINPRLLQFDLSLAVPNTVKDSGVTSGKISDGGTISGGEVSVHRDSGIVVGECSTCQTLSNLKIPTNGSAVGTGVEPGFGTELKSFNTNLTENGITNWSVTEGWPPSMTHSDICHTNGTCVDANISNPTPNNIKLFFSAASGAGLNASYEVKTQTELDSLKNAGIPVSSTCSGNGTACVNAGATGSHFHLRK